MNKHTPLRMCMSCREMKPKSELIRLVATDGKVIIDENSQIQSRGAYVCRSEKCISILKKKKCIGRSLKVSSDEIYDKLSELIIE